MNQNLKSSLLLISLLGISFFAFRFLTNSLNQQSEIPQVETSSTTTTTQQLVSTEDFIPLEITLDDFIDDHKWEPFENYDPSFIWEQIEHLAYSVRNYIDQTQKI